MALQSGEERLISYAVDQRMEVKAEGASRPQEWVAVKINKGTLEKRFNLREIKTYVVKNRSKQLTSGSVFRSNGAARQTQCFGGAPSPP
jgi:hypothetical protein